MRGFTRHTQRRRAKDIYSTDKNLSVTQATQSALRERETYYCVPIPGETLWAREVAPTMADPVPCDLPMRPKRARDETEGSTMTCDEEVDMEGASAAKKASTATGDNKESVPATDSGGKLDFNLPLPWEVDIKRTRCVVVKTYDSEGKALRVMDVVDVVGILHMDFIEYPDDWKTGTRGISYALAPRLHAISVTRRPYFNPAPIISDMNASMIREALLQYLQNFVHGDVIAACYALFGLIQREFKRVDEESYGSINIGLQLADEHATRFAECVRSLMPHVAVLPVSIESLSTFRWFPKKNYESETVMSGLLQLSPGTAVILDENPLVEGKLVEDGLKNLLSIKSYLARNVVDADFEFYPVPLPTYHSNFVLSSGKTPLLEPDVMCPVEPKDTDRVIPDDNMMSAFRSYIAKCVTESSGPMNFEAALTNQLPQDFSQMRQKHNVPSSMCNIWTALARLNAISRGETKIKMDHWREILQMEEMRRERLK
eukprot:GEMP01021405.1.p1 GENE.GEMP01021405.1~~GEMP01021405.1.p1  ORF type:complete len:487 (+),score=101.61 GEMP01021405.1:48-1508(+)